MKEKRSKACKERFKTLGSTRAVFLLHLQLPAGVISKVVQEAPLISDSACLPALSAQEPFQTLDGGHLDTGANVSSSEEAVKKASQKAEPEPGADLYFGSRRLFSLSNRVIVLTKLTKSCFCAGG